MADRIQGLYYITHIDNLPSILEQGILSHNQVDARGIGYRSIFDRGIVNRRALLKTPDKRPLWDYANLYFQPRNPMLFRVKEEVGVDKVVVVKVKASVLYQPGVWLTDGNAAHTLTRLDLKPTDETLAMIANQIDKQYWTDTDDAKRAIMAECLVPDSVDRSNIECVYVARNGALLSDVQRFVAASGLRNVAVVPEPEFFFQPSAQWRLTHTVSLAQGDMFFSRLQTLTISVNTVGVMGKGLASRTRYQFPDVYVKYEDACRDKSLTTKTPVIVKRSKSIASEIAESAGFLGDETATWFLLFATKEHWKEASKIEYIIDGMRWVLDNYKSSGIRSLALPALGCGLGGLKWSEVGPILCSVGNAMQIPVCIYLPAEARPPDSELTASYLIRPVEEVLKP